MAHPVFCIFGPGCVVSIENPEQELGILFFLHCVSFLSACDIASFLWQSGIDALLLLQCDLHMYGLLICFLAQFIIGILRNY